MLVLLFTYLREVKSLRSVLLILVLLFTHSIVTYCLIVYSFHSNSQSLII